jgi:hypothetical protein
MERLVNAVIQASKKIKTDTVASLVSFASFNISRMWKTLGTKKHSIVRTGKLVEIPVKIW